MHPLLRTANGVAGFVLALIPLCLIFTYLFAANGRVTVVEAVVIALPVAAALGLVCLFPYFPCRAIPLSSTPVWIAAGLHAIPAMFFCGAVLAVTRGVLSAADPFFPGLKTRFAGVLPVIAAISCVTYLLSTALHYVFEALERSRKAELLSREAQLKALKAQVNPHFLFNSLNSISALTAVDAKRAREMCVRLADFLRCSLRLGERLSIPFSEELALTQTYLGVEQIRFGDRLRFVQNVEHTCAHCEVPPLVIQPLVENAIKHGVATLIAGGSVSIAARCTENTMKIVIENNFDPEAPPGEQSGFGIANVRNRLEARYGAAASLEASIIDNTYRVVVSAPCKRDPETSTT